MVAVGGAVEGYDPPAAWGEDSCHSRHQVVKEVDSEKVLLAIQMLSRDKGIRR